MNLNLAIELLGLTHSAQWQNRAALTAQADVLTGIAGTMRTATLNGEPVRHAAQR